MWNPITNDDIRNLEAFLYYQAKERTKERDVPEKPWYKLKIKDGKVIREFYD